MTSTVALDSARSWAIALAGCAINVLLSGITRASGLFYVALINKYGVSRYQANLPFTIRNAVRNLAGPVVGAIGQRYGCQAVTIFGGVLGSMGILLCAFAPDLTWIIIFWGGMHGFGVALANTLYQVVVIQYFFKHRASASGLALSGACMGSFVLPVLLEYLLENLGLSGTFLVTGGLIMNVLPACILIKEPPWIRGDQGNQKDKGLKTISNRKMIGSETGELDRPNVAVSKETPPSKVRSVDQANGKVRNGEIDGVYNPAFVQSENDLNEKSLVKNPSELDEEGPVKVRTSSFIRLEGAELSPQECQQETSLYRAVLKVYRDPMFHMISLSLASFALLVDPIFTILADYIIDKGLREDLVKYFISAMAFGDLVGRLSFGWVTDRDYLSIPKFMMLGQIALGVCILTLTLVSGFYPLMALIAVYGLVLGATLVMFPLLVGRYLQTVQSLAMGCMSLFTGFLTFAVPPLIGYFRDEVGSYNGMLCITAGFSILTGLIWLLEPVLMKMRGTLEEGKR